MKKIIALLLALITVLGLVACTGTENQTESPSQTESQTELETEAGPVVSQEENKYLTKYADIDAAEAWIKANISDTDVPPVVFKCNNVKSSDLKWEKTVGEKNVVIDYKDTDTPKERDYYVVTYKCLDCDISIELTVTTYPQYPVVEYEATLINTGDGNTPEIKGLYSIDTKVLDTDKAVVLHYEEGATENGETDFAACQEILAVGSKRIALKSEKGKPTCEYGLVFNLERKDNSGGVVAVMSWQGTWKAEFQNTKDNGLELKAGQNETDFVLTKGESHRLPAIILIYYKDEYIFGQNIYRKWWLEHNFLRDVGTGTRMESDVLLAASAQDSSLYDVQSNAELDKDAIQQFVDYGVNQYGNFFVQDAGWYDYQGASNWSFAVGNWVVDPVRYPNGLKEVSDMAHENGMKYMLWVEPERAMVGSKVYNEISDGIIFIRQRKSGPIRVEADTVNDGHYGLVYLGDEKTCDYMIDLLCTLFEENGVDIYRQDFNFYPADYWTANDTYEEEQLGIPRTGRTEEQHCNGYLRLFRTLLERNPGMLIDACASGGMRYDLATSRLAFMHTLTDWYNVSAEKSQGDVYGASMLYTYYGHGMTGLGDYNVASSISCDTCVGTIVKSKQAKSDKKAFNDNNKAQLSLWSALNDYMLDEYYPLTSYINKSSSNNMVLQYHDSKEDKGMIVAYMRTEGSKNSVTVNPYQIDPDYYYSVSDYLNVSKKELLKGSDIIAEGITFRGQAGSKCVRIYIYEKLNKISE